MESDTHASLLAPGSMITDRLSVVRRLGAGGLGEVYLTQHKFTRHLRAVKVLHAKFRTDADVVERFLREASAAGRIGNPHIVETFDAGYLPDGSPFIVMEFLEGRVLNEIVRSAGRLEVGLAAALMVQICEALQAAHDANIIHRDLKPENLFLTDRDGHAFVKVLDFGVSKFQAEEGEKLSSTRSNITMGTPLYMSPEQLRSAKVVDARSDVYALGVILYELVSGDVPFQANSFAELAVKVLSGVHEPLHVKDGAVPAELSAIVTRAMSLDPAQRFPSASAMGEALEPFARNQPVTQLLKADAVPPDEATHGDTLVRAKAPAQLATPSPKQSQPRAPALSSLPALRDPPTKGSRIAVGAALLVVIGAVGALGVGLRGAPAPAPVPLTPSPLTPPPAAVIPPVVVVTPPAPVEPTPVKVTEPPPPVSVPVPVPVHVRPTAKGVKEPPAKVPDSAVMGEAQFHCNPPDTVCRVKVDGVDLGETDLSTTLTLGTHTALFTTSEGLTRTRQFTVERDSTARVVVNY